MTEKAFENKIKKWLHEQGIYALGTHKQDKKVDQVGTYYKAWGGGFSAVGIPDIICCIKGKFVAIEVKAAKGVASKIQEINTTCINECEGQAYIIYPKDFDYLKSEIRRLI